MKLDRNINPDGRGKYALLLMRKNPILGFARHTVSGPNGMVVKTEAIDHGDTDDTEFFVIRLKDKYAFAALSAYARAAMEDGNLEYANEIATLAVKAQEHPNKRKPD